VSHLRLVQKPEPAASGATLAELAQRGKDISEQIESAKAMIGLIESDAIAQEKQAQDVRDAADKMQQAALTIESNAASQQDQADEMKTFVMELENELTESRRAYQQHKDYKPKNSA